METQSNDHRLPTTSPERLSQSIHDTPFNADVLVDEVETSQDENKATVLYLAYGSNLSAETFKGVRNIRPISQINVLVPELDLTFDLPGIPYKEPCFANTRYRTTTTTADYHKDRWHKGLVGVVYEVSKSDYATIIGTEGGGASYTDITVLCYPLPSDSPNVDPHPSNTPFKAHTLFSPNNPSRTRPDPSYGQPSKRYLSLIIAGAAEHALPAEYQAYLAAVRPYTITSVRQRIGAVILFSFWGPLLFSVFSLEKVVADRKTGRVPKWYAALMDALFRGIWVSYDAVFKRLFGDGERTVGEEEAEHLGERESLLPSGKKDAQYGILS